LGKGDKVVKSGKKAGVTKVSVAPKSIVIKKNPDGRIKPINANQRNKKSPILMSSPKQGSTKAAGSATSTPRCKAIKANTQKPIAPVNLHSTTMETARAIANNKSHRNHSEVAELIRTFEKGWIDQARFASVLQGLLF
jgi:hypothetical protein